MRQVADKTCPVVVTFDERCVSEFNLPVLLLQITDKLLLLSVRDPFPGVQQRFFIERVGQDIVNIIAECRDRQSQRRLWQKCHQGQTRMKLSKGLNVPEACGIFSRAT